MNRRLAAASPPRSRAALLSIRGRRRVLDALLREARLGGARQLFLDGGGFAGSSGGVPFALFQGLRHFTCFALPKRSLAPQ